MKIILKNGKEIEIDFNSLIFEYLEDYEGGLEGLKKDIETGKNRMYVTNHILYAIVCSNYDENLTYRQAIKLVNIEDMPKIFEFISKNSEKVTGYVNTVTKKH